MRRQRMLVPHASLPDTPDARLAARVHEGDAVALGELYSRFAPAMFGLAERLVGRGADAEDVLHDVFLGLPEALRHYNEQGTLASWLKRVTARVALNRLRSERRRAESVGGDMPESRSCAPHPIDAMALRDAIATLPDTLRTVFVLKEVEGFSHAEVAELLDISRGASEVRLHRAIRSLRTILGSAR